MEDTLPATHLPTVMNLVLYHARTAGISAVTQPQLFRNPLPSHNTNNATIWSPILPKLITSGTATSTPSASQRCGDVASIPVHGVGPRTTAQVRPRLCTHGTAPLYDWPTYPSTGMLDTPHHTRQGAINRDSVTAAAIVLIEATGVLIRTEEARPVAVTGGRRAACSSSR
jgi:hypothetical protein